MRRSCLLYLAVVAVVVSHFCSSALNNYDKWAPLLADLVANIDVDGIPTNYRFPFFTDCPNSFEGLQGQTARCFVDFERYSPQVGRWAAMRLEKSERGMKWNTCLLLPLLLFFITLSFLLVIIFDCLSLTMS